MPFCPFQEYMCIGGFRRHAVFRLASPFRLSSPSGRLPSPFTSEGEFRNFLMRVKPWHNPKALPIPRSVSGTRPNWPWNGDCWPSSTRFWLARRPLKPSSTDPSTAMSRNSSSSQFNLRCLRHGSATGSGLRHLVISRKASGGTRSPTGQQDQNHPGFPIPHLARPRFQSSDHLPAIVRFPSTLNYYAAAG